MKRWSLIALYALGLIAEAALLVGVRAIETLSRQKMMLMRFLFAKNIELENGLFSPAGKTVQFWVLAAVAVTFAALAFALWRRTRFASAQSAVGAAGAAAAAWCLHTVPTADDVAIYAVVIALWLVVAVQCIVVAVSAASRQVSQ